MIGAITRVLNVLNNRKPKQEFWCVRCKKPLSAGEVHHVRGQRVCFTCGEKLAHSCPKCGTAIALLGLNHAHCKCGEELVPEYDRTFEWKAVRIQ